MVALIAVFLGIEFGALALIGWLRRDTERRRLVPVVAASAGGLLVAAVAYIWVFQVGPSCSGRGDFACQINSNQGVLTMLGLVLALGAVWTTVLIRFFDQRAESQALQAQTDIALAGAMEEVRHNLIHVALAYDKDGKLSGLPLVKVDETAHLLEQPIRQRLDEHVLNSAELIQRNFGALSRLADGGGSYKEKDADEPEPHCLTGLVNHSLRFLLAAGGSTSAGHQFLHKPGLQDLHEASMAERDLFFCFRTSDPSLRAEAPTLRSDGAWVICWLNDAPPERLRVLDQGPRFDDLAEGHS